MLVLGPPPGGEPPPGLELPVRVTVRLPLPGNSAKVGALAKHKAPASAARRKSLFGKHFTTGGPYRGESRGRIAATFRKSGA